ncbi:hypothetical protein C3L33_17494, partial [Rhododendron williamsianum]
MSGFALLILLLSGILEFPSVSSLIPSAKGYRLQAKSTLDPFSDLFDAFRKWDAQVGCSQFREKHKGLVKNGSLAFQEVDGELGCGEVEMGHVSVLVKGWTWVPDNLDNLYLCRCGLSCLWTKSSVLADKPDALLFETVSPPVQSRFALYAILAVNQSKGATASDLKFSCEKKLHGHAEWRILDICKLKVLKHRNMLTPGGLIMIC